MGIGDSSATAEVGGVSQLLQAPMTLVYDRWVPECPQDTSPNRSSERLCGRRLDWEVRLRNKAGDSVGLDANDRWHADSFFFLHFPLGPPPPPPLPSLLLLLIPLFFFAAASLLSMVVASGTDTTFYECKRSVWAQRSERSRCDVSSLRPTWRAEGTSDKPRRGGSVLHFTGEHPARNKI